MKTLSVIAPSREKSYDIEFLDTYDQVVDKIKGTLRGRSFLIVTDENVFEKSAEFFDQFGKDERLVLSAGEAQKHFGSIEKILTAAFEKNLDRNSVLIAVGGGVIGDMTGFAASIFLRGISFFQIPTSLLAMVDASVGGKTGVNNAYGKNLVGAFYFPEIILSSRAWLDTLPAEEIQNGLAEMVKHAIITSPEHFENLSVIASQARLSSEASAKEGKIIDKLWEIVSDSIQIKQSIVESDTYEQNERMKLNLGHTFGHAIEQLSRYEIAHGHAVAIGTVMAAEYAKSKELCSLETVEKIRGIFTEFGIDTNCPFPETDVWKTMKHDKKRHGKSINLILPRKIGKVEVVTEKF